MKYKQLNYKPEQGSFDDKFLVNASFKHPYRKVDLTDEQIEKLRNDLYNAIIPNEVSEKL